ncbi:hypothetical protein LOK49_LG02G02990 [Camellia lanceoleosa]|uniref:Uncharacterized protein n=1 Tax=Camellia lanceoleosa TaxID=1840588 RepID=A0ACC0IH60_9ERIC|nr:hypothetical protein LOK49_LG02G02990 [Camellia lanceoleosa]
MNYKGLAAGGARGGAPMARIAVYKTCWDSGCYDIDLLAAFDDAIRDGIHILSLSVGPDSPQGDYFSDAILVGSFHATSHGIVVVSSVGNEGNRASATYTAMARIFFAKTVLGSEPAPESAAFSSKGPNALTPEILKPDIAAPGLNILAAWSPAIGKLQSNIQSPFAIKSAIMTTGLFDDEETRILNIKEQCEDPDQFENFLVELLQSVADMDITFKALKETDIGRHVNRLWKNPSNDVRRLVKQLVTFEDSKLK